MGPSVFYPGRSDDELIEEVKQGSRESFEALYNKYVQPIYRFIYHMLNHRERAQDLTQEVFIRLYHNASQFSPTGKFSSWLYRMAKNMTLNYIRDNAKTLKGKSLEAVSEETGQANSIQKILKDEKSDPGQTAVTHEEQELVRSGLSKLKPHDREIIILFVVNELSHQEIGHILGCSATSTKVRLHRARQRLADIIGIKKEIFSES